MTIVQITNSSNFSGGTRQMATLCQELVDAGHRVIGCGPPGSKIVRWLDEHGIAAVALDFDGPWALWRSSRRLRRIAREERADVVHTHHTKGHNVALLATIGGGFPPVVANRGVVFRPDFPAKFRSRRTAGIITNSGTVKAVLERSGVPGHKIHVVYNAKDVPDLEAQEQALPDLRRELALPADGPVVGAVGSGRPEKGFHVLVEAAPAILARHPGAIFVLVGAGTDRLVPRLEELGIGPRFRLTGHRPDARAIMGLFDVYALPSVDMESCPNVLLEAMGAAVPCVAADVGGVREILRDGEFGRVVQAGDPGALAEGILDLLAAPGAAKELGRKARIRVEQDFSPQVKVQQTVAVYERVQRR